MKKLISIICFCLILFSVSGCDIFYSGSEDEDPKLEVGADFVSECGVASGGAVFSFSFEANCEWIVTPEVDWITVSPSTGRGSATVEVTVEPYEDIFAQRSRTADIDIDATSGYLSVSERIRLTQLPMRPELQFAAGTDLTPKVSSKGGTLSFSFETNKEWRIISYPDDWFTVSPSSGKGASTIEVTVAPNTTVGPRVEDIEVEVCAGQSEACECSKAITITQDSEQPVPDNVIYYTSSTDKRVPLVYSFIYNPDPNKPIDGFGAKELTNTYSNGLGTITFDGPVTRIPNKGPFSGGGWRSIIIPDSVTSIGKSAFVGSGIGSLVIPDSVTEIDSGTLPSPVSIPDHFKTIGLWFIGGFHPGFGFLDGVTSIEAGAFSGCETYASIITIPEGITSIAEDTFSNASFAYIEFPESVKEIGAGAFRGSRLKNVTIPENITSIGKEAFDCYEIDYVIFESMTPPSFGEDVFGIDGDTMGLDIYVPAAALNAYKSALGLEEYFNIHAFYGDAK